MENRGKKICVSCGREYENNYCSYCGQKEMHSGRLSVMHLFEEVLELFTHLDNKIFRSLWYVISKPGYLTKEYLEGRTVKYMKPLQLFVIINVLLFLLLRTGGGNPLSISLAIYKNYSPYTTFGSVEAIQSKLEKSNISFENYAPVFDAKIEQQSKVFAILLIPMFGTLFWLFFFRKRKYWAEHIITATHFMSFVMLYWIVFRYIFIFPMYRLFGFGDSGASELVYSIASATVIGTYLTIAFRRIYGAGRVYTVIVSVLTSTVLFFLIITLFRILLFYKIIWWG